VADISNNIIEKQKINQQEQKNTTEKKTESEGDYVRPHGDSRVWVK